MSIALSTRTTFKGLLPWAGGGLCLVLLLASHLVHDALFHGRALLASPPAREAPAPTPTPTPALTLTLPEGKWKAAGIRTAEARRVAVPSEVGVAGKIEANPDRRVEVRPRAPGIVRTVSARLGQHVKKGDVLAVLDSPDAGTARLNLRGRQIELATARAELDWKRQIAGNVARLIPEINHGVAATKIQKEYAERPLGSDRALLLQAYAEYEIAAHEAEKTSALFKEQIIGEHPRSVALHTLEGAQAKLQGIVEQITNDAKHELRVAEQKVRLAEFAVIDAAERLRILGIKEDITELLARAGDVAAGKAAPTDDDVTACPVAAPFDGTVIDKKAVPSQKADSSDVLFVVADLRTVWVMANVTESDLGLLPTLRDGTIRLGVTAYPGQTFDATILSVGALVDPTTRTVPLLAETANPDGRLKLGMFARIVFDTPALQDALTVPAASVIAIDDQPGVFLPSGKTDRTYFFRPVKPGRVSGDRQVVLDGLAPGDTVVSSGAFFLKSELILQNEPED